MPSKNIWRDEDLSWEEMWDMKNTLLHFMALSGVWPAEHTEPLAAFFVTLDLHPRKQQLNGKQALVMYKSWVRCKWFDALKCNEGFNIEIIQDTLLCSYVEEISNKMLDRRMEQLGPLATMFLTIRSPGPCFFPYPTSTSPITSTTWCSHLLFPNMCDLSHFSFSTCCFFVLPLPFAAC